MAPPDKVADAIAARFGGLVDRVLCSFSFVPEAERKQYVEALRAR